MDAAPSGLLLTRDLMFTSKVVGTGQALGLAIKAVGALDRAEALIAERPPRVVFVDLAAGDLTSPEALARLMAAAPGVPFVAFGSHVDADALDAARRAGCREVMPRSKFTLQLPDLVRAYLGDGPADASSS